MPLLVVDPKKAKRVIVPIVTGWRYGSSNSNVLLNGFNGPADEGNNFLRCKTDLRPPMGSQRLSFPRWSN